jgi:hypothetical protein
MVKFSMVLKRTLLDYLVVALLELSEKLKKAEEKNERRCLNGGSYYETIT